MADWNQSAFEASLDRMADPLNFARNGLGKRLLDSQAKRIAERAADQRGTKGKWAKNKGEYGRRKAAKGLPVGVGLRPSDSPMLLMSNLQGDQDVTPDEATMTYGKTEGAREVAGFFEAARPFYGLQKSDEKAIRDQCAADVSRNLKG